MKTLLKAIVWPFWWVWVRYTYAICFFKAVDVELEMEDIQGRRVDSDLEVQMLRHEIHVRWGWNDPPAPVGSFLAKVAVKVAAQLAAKAAKAAEDSE